MNTALRIGALLSITLGLFIFNYTTDGKAAAHRVWAQENGFPEPSNTVFLAGLAAVILGALVLFFAAPRRRGGG